MEDSRWLYAWALASAALGGASLLVPLYVVSLGGGPVALGLLAASAAFVGAPGALVVGRVADRTSRRRVFVVGGMALAAVGLAGPPLTDSIPVVVAANAVVWFAAGAVAPVLSLLVVAEAPEREWTDRYARLNAYQGYGWAGGLVLGVVWTAAGAAVAPQAVVQRSFFAVCVVCAAAGTALAVRWVPVDGPTSSAPSGERRARRVARAMTNARRLNLRGATFPLGFGRLYWTTAAFHPRRFVDRFTPTLALYFGGVVLFFTGFAVFFAPLPAFLTGVGFTDGAVFGLYLVSSLGAAAFYGPAGRLLARSDLPLLQSVGLAVRGVALPAVALVGAALATSTRGVVLTAGLFVVIGVAWALIAISASTLVTRIAPASIRGEALGVFAALAAVAGGVGSVLGGRLAAGDFGLAFGAAGALVLAGAAVILLVRQRTGPLNAPA